MSTYDLISEAVSAGRVHVSEHAYDEALDDQLAIFEVLDAVPQGEVIEDYPDDLRGSSCLVLLHLEPGSQPVHAVLGYDAKADRAIVVTVYRPDPGRWTDDFRVRRPRS